MKKTVLFIIILFLFTIATLFTQETTETTTETERTNISAASKEEQYYQVEGLENWHYDFDIAGYPEGKYNILIKGTDLAGNEYIEGPFNIHIDPSSDKPVTNISNPTPGMRVGGNLNIVGTSIDDDSVERVEVQINDGEFLQVNGIEFWSFYLSTDELEDGEYTVTARGVDENGTIGDSYSVNFVLDKSRPYNEVTSFENGALLNGKVTLEGLVKDKNGVEKLELSTDGGETFTKVSIKTKKNEPTASFSIKIDTKKLDDGPQIYWFRSTDKMGSVGVSAFLFFVDNKEPTLEILYPTEDFQVNGKFRVVGRVFDEVGIENLTFKHGKNEPVEIPLSIGDPYWFQDVDFSNEAKTDIVFTLTDTTGNTIDYKMQVKLDLEGDLPNLHLLTPVIDSNDSIGTISGYATDDDGVKEIVYSIDGSAPVSVPTQHSFNTSLGELSSGSHKLEIYAVDINDVAGEKIKLSFTNVLEAPEISFESVTLTEGDSTDDISPGMEINLGKYKAVNGTVQINNLSGKAMVSINGGEKGTLSLKKTDKPDVMAFSIPLKNLSPGFTGFELDISDKFGLSANKTLFLMLHGIDSETGEVVRAPADNKLYTTDNRFPISKASPDPIRLLEGEEIIFFLNGGSVEEANLSEGSEFLEITVEDNLITLKAVSPGYSEACEITISTSSVNNIPSLGPFIIGVDTSAPEIQFEKDFSDSIFLSSIDISGTVSDNVGINGFYYSIDEGSPIQIELEEGAFNTTLNLENESDGGILLNFKATDNIGNVTVRQFLITKDSEPPTIEQLTPLSDLEANGKITFTGKTQDNGRIQTVEFSEDGETYIPIKNTEFPALPIDLTLYNEETTVYSLRITDDAGNIAIFTPSLKIDMESDKPEVQIQIPREDELIQTDFIISGMAFDDDDVTAIFYRIDDGEFLEIEGANSFEIPIQLRDISDNRHTVEIKAVDPGGVESETEVLTFNVSKREPVSHLTEPALESTGRGLVKIAGESSDENGISTVMISYDNGNTFNRAEIIEQPVERGGSSAEIDELSPEDEKNLPEIETSENSEEDTTENGDLNDGKNEEETIITERILTTSVRWQYILNTRMLEDGTQSILVKAIDNNGVEELYTSLINIDNTAPEIQLSEIPDGLQIVESLELKGRVTDNIQLADVKLEIRQLSYSEDSDTADPETEISMDLPVNEILLQNIDMSQFSSGWINLRVTAFDYAGNKFSISRNIEKIGSLTYNRVMVFSPADGEILSGEIIIQGKIESLIKPVKAALYIDGFPSTQLEINESGYYHARLSQDNIDDGIHQLTVEVELEDGTIIKTEERELSYSKLGPWISIDNFIVGEFASNRPWIKGNFGYNYQTPEMDEKSLKSFHKEKEIDQVEVSLNNGRSFSSAKIAEEWKFRLETQDVPNGELGIIVRAIFKDGATAVAKTKVIVDDTPPRIEMIAPSEGMRFNNTISLSGIGSDTYGLQNISVALREGDKSRYQIPSFIQGLYIDAHFLGSTYMEIGAGLTFFDDNVKLQMQLGMAPPGRFNGFVVGVKLLANIAVLPYEYFFGHDWSFLSSSLAVGATFNYFTMSEEEITFTAQGLVLGAIIGQIELIKITIPDRKLFSSFSLYTEGQLWFISSDVSGGVEARMAFGLRTNIF
jgi:hypothetical protein